jgi:DNA polymerase-1
MTDLKAGISLEALALKYLGRVLNKEIRKTFGMMKPMQVFTKEQLAYGVEDTEVLFPIYNMQLEALKEKELLKVAELEFELTEVVADMEETGVPINQDKWHDIYRTYQQKHEDSRIKIHELVYDHYNLTEQLGMFERAAINLNSPAQVKAMFQKIGVKIDSTDERALGLVNHPVAKELLEYRKFQKIMTSYGDTFLNEIHPFDNRIHADFMQIGTETGRFSCRKPNMQQMPKEFRECVSDPNYSIVVADYSQFELRILAEMSRDPVLIQAFNSGADLHRATAALMFDIIIEAVTDDQRQAAKTLNFGMVYGMGPGKLMDSLNAGKEEKDKITLARAKALVGRYKATYVKATTWLQEAGTTAYRQGYSMTTFGRKRFFTRPKFNGNQDDFDQEVASIKRQGANFCIQGGNADCTKLAMINLHNELEEYFKGSKIILQVHDEIVVLAQKSQAEAVKQLVEETMVKAAQEFITVVPIMADAKVVDCWKKD